MTFDRLLFDSHILLYIGIEVFKRMHCSIPFLLEHSSIQKAKANLNFDLRIRCSQSSSSVEIFL
jgi:hypothetical protein